MEKDMTSDLKMFHRKMTDFVSFPLFEFTFVITLSNLKVIEILYYLFIKKLIADLNMSFQTLSDLVETSFEFSFDHNLRNGNFKLY